MKALQFPPIPVAELWRSSRGLDYRHGCHAPVRCYQLSETAQEGKGIA